MSNSITTDYIDVKYHSPESLVTEIQEAWEKYGKANVSFEVAYDYDYGDNILVRVYLVCQREMNETEKAIHKTKIETKEKRVLERQLKQYEELKKKFGE